MRTARRAWIPAIVGWGCCSSRSRSCGRSAGERPGRVTARDRPPRRERLSARPHAGGLRAGDQARRRLHRARPGRHEGRPPDRPSRAEHHQHDRRGEPSRVRRPARRPRWWTGSPRPASSRPTSRSPRSRRCGRSSRWRSDRSGSTARSRSRRSGGHRLAKRWSRKRDRPIGVYPETKHPTYHARSRAAARAPAREGAAPSRAGTTRRAPVFIQSFEQSNLELLDRLTPVRLVQLVDANDVAADGTITYAPPFDRPYDWTVSGDPELQSRTFGYFTTDAGLEEISEYADGIGPWKPYIVSSRATALNPDGTVADANGDGLVDERDRTLLPPTDLVERAHDARPADPHLDVPQRAAPARQRLRRQPGRRVPALLPARRRRGLRGLPRHRVRVARAVPAGGLALSAPGAPAGRRSGSRLRGAILRVSGGDPVSTGSVLRKSCKPRSPVGLVKPPGTKQVRTRTNSRSLPN